jgi:hypothetical protein
MWPYKRKWKCYKRQCVTISVSRSAYSLLLVLFSMCHIPAVPHFVLIVFSVSLKYSKYCTRFEVLTVVLKKVQASKIWYHVIGKYLLTFWRNVMSPSSGSTSARRASLTLKMESLCLSEKLATLPVSMVLFPRRF